MLQNLRAIRILQAAGLALAAALLPAAGCDDIGSGDQIGTHTVRLSLTKTGKESTGPVAGSTTAALSGDGRFAAFQSDMTGLVNGDGNTFPDIFVKDRSNATIELVSFNSSSLSASFAASREPVLSADGNIVAFASEGGLALGAGFSKDHIYIHNRTTHVTSRLLDPAINPSGIIAVPSFFSISISDDGTKVAFASTNTNLVAGVTVSGSLQVYVADLTTSPSTITLVSRSATVATTGANAACLNPRISGDGLSVVFQSGATDLILTATPPMGVYLGTSTGAVCDLVSLTNAGANPGGNNTLPSVSRTGRFVAFLTDSPSIAPILGVGIAVRDRTAATTTVVSIDSTGAFIAGDLPVISPDGSRIAFTALPVGGAGFTQIWTRDLITNVSAVASVHLSGALADADCFRPAWSADSAWIGWDTAATNLVTSDGNGQSDIFVRGPLTR